MALGNHFDPDLMYVECGRCGLPVIWEAGKSAEVVEWSGIRLDDLDAGCMIVSDGCPTCTPSEHSFATHVVRLELGDGRPPPPPGGKR